MVAVHGARSKLSGVTRTVPRVMRRPDRLLQDIQSGALDSRVSITALLRKVIALGGQAGSAELRDWATKELRGYDPEDELPSYRVLTAPLLMDAATMRGQIRGQALSPSQLPDFAQDRINNTVHWREGIGQVEVLVRRTAGDDPVRLQPGLAQELVHYMNASGQWQGQIERIYWGVSPAVLEGMIEQVRTTLTVLTAEITAHLPDGSSLPPAEVATNAINVAVSGRRHRVVVTTAQESSTVTPAEPDGRRWLASAGAVLLGLVAIVGAFFALMQAQGWAF
jgi:hypothetical protein